MGYITLEEYNAFFGVELTEEDFQKYQSLAVVKLKYLIGFFPTPEQFQELNEEYQSAVRNALLYEINHIESNKAWFFESENAFVNSVSLGRFSVSEAPTNGDVEDIASISLEYLQSIGWLKTRALNTTNCGCIL